MIPVFSTTENAYNFLTNNEWVVMNTEDVGIDFQKFFEMSVFKDRGEEFEVAIVPVIVIPKGQSKEIDLISCWFRFKKTDRNLQAFYDAVELFCKKPLSKNWRKMMDKESEILTNKISIREGRIVIKDIKMCRGN
jgi:hypothetical protein